MSNEQCAMCNMCLLQNDVDFPLLIAHCSLLIWGVWFRGSMREMLAGGGALLARPSLPAWFCSCQRPLFTVPGSTGNEAMVIASPNFPLAASQKLALLNWPPAGPASFSPTP